MLKVYCGQEDAKKKFIYKRRFSYESRGIFKLRLHDLNRSKVKQCRNANEAYINFLNIIDSLCNECFPVAGISLNQKKRFTPSITRGIKKSSKRKKELYEKFLKHRNILSEENYKTYKNLFE